MGGTTSVSGRTYYRDSLGAYTWTRHGQVIVRPSGTGTNTQFSTQNPTTGSHWDKVDEASQDEDTTYIQSPSDAQVDDFAHPTLSSLGVSSNAIVNWIQVNARAKYTVDGTQRCIGPFVNSGGSVAWDDRLITSSYANYSGAQRTTNPSTGTFWTISGVDSMRFGVRHCYTATVRVTQSWMVVDYTY